MIRVGVGFDAHAFAAERPLILGGVEIPSDVGLVGHSDADVLSHAVGDALLGAANLGDLGEMFPDDEQWRGAVSLRLLADMVQAVRAAGWEIVNVDATLVAEAPRISPYRAQMVANLAGALGLDPELVSIKATSTDALGFVGRREGIAALAVALIQNA